MATICKYCNEPENKQDRPGLICESCICFVHLSCLRSEGTPGDFSCDVFFDFTCVDCSVNKKEVFTRNRFPWVNVILLTLHHLNAKAYGISNHGFFHYKMHICSFIDRSWLTLFGSDFKQKKNWVGTIAGALSVYNNLFFKSGSAVLGEQGWWRLQHAFSPAVAAHIIQEMARYKPKGRPRNQMALDQTLFFGKVTEMGYKELLQSDTDPAPEPEVELVPPAKKPRMDSDDMSGISSTSYYDRFDSNSRTELAEDMSLDEHQLTLPSREESYSDAETMFRGFDFQPPSYMPPSDSSSLYSFQNSIMYYDSDSRSGSPSNNIPETPFEDYEENSQIDIKKSVPPETKTKKPVAEERLVFKTESLFSTQPNSIGLPWVNKPPEKPKKNLVAMTPYEEIQLLKQIENLIPKVKEPNSKAYLCRLKAKLALRRLKRQKHLPIFDLDKSVKLLGGYVTEDVQVAAKIEGVLDRFHRNYQLDSLCGTVSSGEHGVTLIPRMGSVHSRSPFSGALLKPYIRRDENVDALWPRIMDELLVKTHRHQAGYKPPARGALMYSYVRPEHIAAVNNLCAQFFWPGIDMTEALQYPEHSCVVTYKRLVVAYAFLVPDVSTTEAYISFVLVRPEWRNAKIATFMLYHLLQTCTGKDVTLHVSPTNPAIFLYQKFGFKVEELIQDFYEKYYDIDYKGCRHALFLRLTR